jgi:hypothetical protein
VHVLSIADNPRLNAKRTHPGHRAKAKALAAGRSPKEGQWAFREAMRAWQDSYYRDVGIRHGLTRIGPRKRRLTRVAWRQQQQDAQAAAERMTQGIMAEAKASQIIRAAENQARAIAAAAEREADATRKERQAEIEATYVTIEAWCAGILMRAGTDAKGEPTIFFHAERLNESQPVLDRLENHIELAARVVALLPDRLKIHNVAKLAAELAPVLDAATRAKAAAVTNMFPSTWQKGTGR